MNFKKIQSKEIPIKLLLLADPSEANIKSYLDGAQCFVAYEGDMILGVAVTKVIDALNTEIHNISIYPEYQKIGIGTKLLEYSLACLKEQGVKTVKLGTGSFGYQLTYYQRIGFRVESVIKDYFLENYSSPVFENGIQHKDMLRLYIELS